MGSVKIEKQPGILEDLVFDDVLSFQNFTQRCLITRDFNNKIVYASCFSQDNPDTVVFNSDTIGTIFVNCNLDNVLIPVGVIIRGGSQRRYKVQNDGNDWIVSKQDKPLEPINAKQFIKRGLPIPDPKDIPLVKVEKAIDLLEEAKKKAGIV